MNLTLRNKVLITFLGTLLIGIVFSIGYNTIVISSFSNDSADLTFEAILEEELKGLDRLSSDRALLVEEYINAVTTDLEVMFDYASALFQGNITAQVRDTYWADPAIMTDIPPGFTNIGYDPYEVGARSWEYSTIFLPEVQNEADLLALDAETQQLIDTSSALDFVFQAVHEANLDYIWIYAGFENDLFRQLPYNDVSWARDDPSTFEDETWYITDEPWYTETIAKDGLNVFLDEDPDFEILYVTAAKPIKNLAGDILGVIAVDLPIDILVDAISGDNILENGYAYMIDSQNEVLMHPLLAEDADVFGSSVTEIEFESSSERQEFEQVLVTIQEEGNGRETFDKNDELWYVAFAEVYDGEFSILVVVPEADILAAPQAISTSIFTSLRRQLIIFFLFMAVIAAIVAFMGTYASKRVVEPIKELTEVTELIAKGNLSKDLSEQYQSSSEITLLYESFRGLITTLRFGNQDYYAGDLNRAMSNYESALELFTNLNNNTGVGICYNNIGNIYRARGNLKDANAYYRKAVEIGKELLDGSSKEEQKQHILGLSSRYNNLGLLYQEIQEYERSEGFIEEAMKYDKMVDNARGFATRHGNLGLIHLDQSDFEAARKSFEEAESIAKSLGSARALSYVAMNWGSYYRATGSNEKAIEYFLSAAEQADNLDVRVVTTSLKNLEEIYESQGNTDLASEIDSRLKKLSTTTRVKEVTFVLDYSGSMAGKRIISAVAGMRNIFKDQIGDRDTVSIISFDSESRILVPPKVKGENIREYMLTFDNLNRPYGATAMYDALGEAFNDFLNRPSSSTQWIICLTDGDDNSSRRYNPSLVKDMARRSVGVNLVIIGVGNLRDQRVLEDICAATDRGNYIHVSQGVGDAITQAFEEVSSMLSEVEVEGFVPDF